MNSMNVKAECVSSASELMVIPRDLRLIMTTQLGSFVDSCAGLATKYLVTFEMTIKPLPEEPSISGSHPLTDGLDK